MRISPSLILLLFPLLLSATNTKITRVVDCNLFELKDGSLVRLANVKAPSVFKSASEEIRFARFVKKYAEKEYRSYPVSVEYSGKKDSSGYALVHLFQYYPLQTLHINKEYLKKGFGRYIANDSGKYDEAYRSAANYAKIHQLGIWNLSAFKAANFSDYAVSAFYGYSRPRDTNYETSYNEFTLRFAPAKEMSGLEARAAVFIKRESGRLCCDCPGGEYTPPYSTETSIGYSISGIMHQTFKWAGFSVGMTYLNANDFYCHEGSEHLVFPSATVKAGWMKKWYLSASFWDYFRRSEYSFGMHYLFSNPFNRLWIGMGSYSDFQNRAFQLDYNIFKNYLLHIQGGYLLKEKPEAYGRIGLGFILH